MPLKMFVQLCGKGVALIPKICKRGTSFKKLAKYLLTDRESGAEREGTSVLGLCNFIGDTAQNAHEAAAIMGHTWQWRDAIKHLSGRGGGTSKALPVWHGVVNFDKSERPTDEEMLLAAKGLLAAVGLGTDEGFQTFFVKHTDTDHHHVHIVVNLIHPVTGLAANPGLEFPKAQKWAAQWEKDRGQDFCVDRAEKYEAIEKGDPIPKSDKKKWLSKAEWLAQQGLTNDNKSPAKKEFADLLTKNRGEMKALCEQQKAARNFRAGRRNAAWEAYQEERDSINSDSFTRRKEVWARRAIKVLLPLSQRAFRDWEEQRQWDRLSKKLWKQKRAWRQRERGFLGRIYNAVAVARLAEKGRRGGVFFDAAIDKRNRDGAFEAWQRQRKQALSRELRNGRKFEFSTIELEKNFALNDAAGRYKQITEALKKAETEARLKEGIKRGVLRKQHEAAYAEWRKKHNIPERQAPHVQGVDTAKATTAPHRQGGVLVDHGWAHFNFDRNEKKNYFVRWRDHAGQEQTTWGIDLARVMPESAAAIGDYVTLTNKGNQLVTVQVPLRDKSGRIYDYEQKEVRRNTWAVTVGQAEQNNTEQPKQQGPKQGARSAFNAAAVIDAATEEKTRHAAQKRKEWADKNQTNGQGWKMRSKERKPRNRQPRDREIT